MRDLSKLLAEEGRKEVIDFRNVSILPAYSASKIPTTVKFLKNEALTVIADADANGDSAIMHLIKDNILNEDEVIKLRDIAGINSKCKTIEDFIPKKLFLNELNNVYSEIYDDWEEITPDNIPGDYHPIIPKIEQVLKEKNLDPEIEKIKVAQRIIERCDVKLIIDERGVIDDQWKKIIDLINRIYKKTK